MSWAGIGTVGSLALGGAGMFMGGKSGGGGVTGPMVVELPQYKWTKQQRKTAADFTMSQLNRMQGPNAMPEYLAQAMPTLRENMSRPLRETYWGSSGLGGSGGGILNQVRETGAALGTGPKAVVAQENKALFDYANAEKGIDEYLTKLGVDVMQADARYFTGLQLARGPEAQVVGGQAYGGGSGGGAPWDAFGSVMGALPYMMKGQKTGPYSNAGGYESNAYLRNAPLPQGYAQNIQGFGGTSAGPPVSSSMYSTPPPGWRSMDFGYSARPGRSA